ncbi:uncharacterized protein METZ01_LOCUS421911, partial [marine metagenome]
SDLDSYPDYFWQKFGHAGHDPTSKGYDKALSNYILANRGKPITPTIVDIPSYPPTTPSTTTTSSTVDSWGRPVGQRTLVQPAGDKSPGDIQTERLIETYLTRKDMSPAAKKARKQGIFQNLRRGYGLDSPRLNEFLALFSGDVRTMEAVDYAKLSRAARKQGLLPPGTDSKYGYAGDHTAVGDIHGFDSDEYRKAKERVLIIGGKKYTAADLGMGTTSYHHSDSKYMGGQYPLTQAEYVAGGHALDREKPLSEYQDYLMEWDLDWKARQTT